jgi:hypothetical protein
MKIQLINREGEVERTQQLREVESILPSKYKSFARAICGGSAEA